MKKAHLIAGALLVCLCLAFSPTAGAADVVASVDKIDNPEIQASLTGTEEDLLGSYDASAGSGRLRRVLKILRTTDKAQVNQYVPVAFEFRNVNPYSVIRWIRRTVEVEEGNWWTFVAPGEDKRLGDSGLLLVNIPSWQVEPFKELVALIDRPGLTTSSGSRKVYHALKHRDPGDEDFRNTVRTRMSETGKAIEDRATGHLYLEDSPSGVANALELLEEMDVPTRQILLRAKVYEIDLTNDAAIGLDFHAWKNGPGRNLFAVGAFSEYFRTSRLNAAGVDGAGVEVVSPGVDTYGLPSHRFQGSGYNGSYFYDVPSAFFDFLVVKGRARVLTAPRATVLNTEQAWLGTGEEILYYRVQNGPSPLAGLRPVDTPLDPLGYEPAYPDNRTLTGDTMRRTVPAIARAGVFLGVRPMIGEESINLEIQVSVVSQLGFDDEGVPLLHGRNIETQIRATPGKEYIIGGLTRTRAIQSSRKMPILGSIPGLGWLFGGETSTAKRTLLAIVVSAELLEDFSGMGEEESQVTEAVAAEGMDHIALPQSLYGFDMMLMGKYANR